MEESRTFLITGAGRDMGLSFARSLAAKGCFALLHYANSKAGAESALEMIRDQGGDGAAIQADFTKLESIARFGDHAKRVLGSRKLDVLIHNAAYTAASPEGNLDPHALDNVLRANILTPLLLTDAMAPLLNSGASVIAVSVASAHKVFSPEFGLFSASKAALETLVQNWAVQFGDRGIRANAVAPGVVEVNFRADLLKDEGFRTNLKSMTALGRVGQVEDLTKVITFLASPQSAWVTGQVIEASGGWKL